MQNLSQHRLNRLMLFVTVLCCYCTSAAYATIYTVTGIDSKTHNATFTSHDSLPALFGSYLEQGLVYSMRLQESTVDPEMCDSTIPEKERALRIPDPISAADLKIGQQFQHNTSIQSDSDSSNNATSSVTASVALLVPRGGCSFIDKARVAESLSKDYHIKMLIVYNNEGYDEVVTMFSEDGDTSLVMMAVTKHDGSEIKKWLKTKLEVDSGLLENGGPVIYADSSFSTNNGSSFDFKDSLTTLLSLTLITVGLIALVVVVVGAMGRLRVVMTPQGPMVIHSLLTDAQVREISKQVKAKNRNNLENTNNRNSSGISRHETSNIEPNDENNLVDRNILAENNNSNNVSAEEKDDVNAPSCVVCLEELNSHNVSVLNDENTILLPCNHLFHADCIIPWLSERQAKCPLCNYNVLEYVRDEMLNKSNISSSNFSRIKWAVCCCCFNVPRGTRQEPNHRHSDLELVEQN